MRTIIWALSFAAVCASLVACGGSGGSDDGDESDPPPEPSVFQGTWLSQDSAHFIKAVVDSAGIPKIYLNDGFGTYELNNTYTSPLSYNATTHVISLPDDAHFYGLDKWTGSFSEDGKIWAKSGTLQEGVCIFACAGGSMTTGIGTWTGFLDDCNSDCSRNYRKASFSFAVGLSASSVSAEGQTIDVGTPVPPAVDLYGATFTFSDWTLNPDGTGQFRFADSSAAAGMPNGVYNFIQVGSVIVFGITDPDGADPALPSTLDEVKSFQLVKQ